MVSQTQADTNAAKSEYATRAHDSEARPAVRNPPGLEPVGIEGCMTCAALSVSREAAREAGVSEAVATANREIGNHPHSAVGQGRSLPMVSVWGVAV